MKAIQLWKWSPKKGSFHHQVRNRNIWKKRRGKNRKHTHNTDAGKICLFLTHCKIGQDHHICSEAQFSQTLLQTKARIKQEERCKAFTPLSVLTTWNTPSYSMAGWGANAYPPRDLWPILSECEAQGCIQTNSAPAPWESCSCLLHPSASGLKHKSHCRF